jgi:hypothetical protein
LDDNTASLSLGAAATPFFTPGGFAVRKCSYVAVSVGLGLVLSAAGAQAQVITSTKSGLAQDPTVWSDNQLPSFSNDYQILSGHTVTLGAGDFQGFSLQVNDAATANFAASELFLNRLVIQPGAALTESVAGDFALGQFVTPPQQMQLNGNLGISIDPGTTYRINLDIRGSGNLDVNSGAGAKLELVAQLNHGGRLRFNGSGDEVRFVENFLQGVSGGTSILEMNSTGANRLVYGSTVQFDDGTIIFNQPGSMDHAVDAGSRIQGPNQLIANAPITVDLTKPYPNPDAPSDERRFLISGIGVTEAIMGSGDITVNGSPTNHPPYPDPVPTPTITLNEFEIGQTGEGTIKTNTYSGTITANEYVNMEIRNHMPRAKFVVNNHARLEMGHQIVTPTLSIQMGEVVVNNGGTLDVGFEQGAIAQSGVLRPFPEGHHASRLTITDDGGRNGSLTLNDGATVRLQVNGKSANQFDTIAAEGKVALNGALNILVNPEASSGTGVGFAANPIYAPTLGDKLTLITAGGAGPTDFNDSGTVDGGDLAVWQAAFGVNANADADGDGDSDGADFLAWQRELGGGAISGTFDSLVISDPNNTMGAAGLTFKVNYLPTSVELEAIAAPPLAAVPEPATLGMVCLLVGLGCRRRRK